MSDRCGSESGRIFCCTVDCTQLRTDHKGAISLFAWNEEECTLLKGRNKSREK